MMVITVNVRPMWPGTSIPNVLIWTQERFFYFVKSFVIAYHTVGRTTLCYQVREQEETRLETSKVTCLIPGGCAGHFLNRCPER